MEWRRAVNKVGILRRAAGGEIDKHRELEGEGKWWALLKPKGEGGRVEVCHAVLQGGVRRGRVVLQCAEMPGVIPGNEQRGRSNMLWRRSAVWLWGLCWWCEWCLSSWCSGVLVPGGFGVRGTEGKIQAISWARKQKKPFLGEKCSSSIRRSKAKKETE